MVLIVASVFGALSYLPFVTSVIFYPTGSLVSADGYLNRSPVGNGLQVVYGLCLLGLGYVIGKKAVFESKYLPPLMLSAYCGAVIGYVFGLPGLETTTVSGGIFLFEADVLNAAHIQSAFFNSATLMGLLVAGIGLSSVSRRRASSLEPAGEGKPTSTRRLIAIFVVATVIAFLAYMLPPAFSLAFSQAAGPSAATKGFLLSFQTNSIVIANPLLFFVLVYLVGSKVNIQRDAGKILLLLFVAVLVGAVAGNPVGSYAAVSIASGMGMFPDYLANSTSLAAFLTAAFGVSFAGAFLGFAAIFVSATRRMTQEPQGKGYSND